MSGQVDRTADVTVGREAVPHLTKLVEAMRQGSDHYFDGEAVEWAEFLAECISDGVSCQDDEEPVRYQGEGDWSDGS